MTYEQFVFYAVLLALLHLPRTELKKKVVDSPDVLSVIHSMPDLAQILSAFYECEYRKVFEALGAW